MRRLTAFLAVAALALAACGSSGSGSSGGAEGQKYVDAIMSKYNADAGSDVFTKSQARCLAEGIVDSVGVDKLQAAGVTPQNINSGSNAFTALGKKLDEAEARDLVGVITDGKCFSFSDVVVKQASKGSSSFGKLGTAKVKCLFDKLLANKAFKQAMVDSVLGRDSSSNAFSNAFKDQSKLFSILGDCNIRPSELSGT